MIFKTLAKDSVIYGGADLITKLIYFFTFPIVASYLSTRSFGVFELIFTTISLCGIFVNCGLNNAVQRYYWDKDTTENVQSCIVTSGLFAQIIFGVVAILIGLIAMPFIFSYIEDLSLPITMLSLIAAIFILPLSQWTQYILDVLRLHFAPWSFFVLALLTRGLSLAFGVLAVVWLHLGVDGLLTAQALTLFILMPLSLWMIRKNLSFRFFNLKWFKELIHFGYPFIYSGIAYWLFGSMDRWMLASMASVEEVGIYSVAFRFASVVLFVSVAFGQAWSPLAMKIRKDFPNEYRSVFGYVLLILLYVMLTFGGGVALFSGEILSLLMPEEYFSSAFPLAILCFGIILQSSQQVTAIGVSIEKKTYLFARVSWLVAFVNLIGNFILIPLLGASGAAISTLISYFVLTSSYVYLTQNLHPLVLEWKKIIFLFLLGGATLFFALHFLTETIDILLIAIKLLISTIFLYLGWQLLPLNELKAIK